jgi:hypothetical protein
MSDNLKLKAVPTRYRSSQVQAYEIYGGYEIIVISYPIEPGGDDLSEARECIDILNIPI